MRTVWNKWGALAVATIFATATAFAQLPEEQRLDLRLDNADLATAVQMLGQKTGLQFVIEPSEEPFKPISLNLKGQTLESVLKALCTSAGATFRREEGGYYVIGRAKAAPPIEAGTATAPPKSAGPKSIQKFKLLHADPQEVLIKMYGGQVPDARDKLAGLMSFMRFSGTPMSSFLSNVNFANPATQSGNFQPVNSKMLEPTAERGSNILLPGESGAQRGGGGLGGGLGGGGLGGGGLGGGGLGGGGLGQGGLGGGGLGGGGLGGGGLNLQGGTGFVPTGIDQITYDPIDNSLIVQGTDEAIAELQRLITMFDEAPKQVTIKVEFITTSSSVANSLGFDWSYERGSLFAGARPGAFARAGDPIYVNYSTGNIVTRMRTLLQYGQGKVVQAPIVRTLNNQPATIIQGISTTFFVNTVVGNGNGQTIIAPQPFPVTIQTGLSVAPRINNDGTVTVFLQVPVQDFGQLRRSSDGTEIPDQLFQQISVVARVKDGETIALGGMVRKQDTGSTAKFPVLGDLPVVGSLFRSRTRDRNNSELLIFVTPTVIKDDGNGGLGPL
ncbi:MAG: hypothetical protein HZC36_15705 [Armatimonadetes bacterium]|nr:hypothetical protein [Armatimonadota bacterium]